MDNPLSQELAERIGDAELKLCVGFFNWERYLTDEQLEILAFYRFLSADDDTDTFAHQWVRTMTGPDLEDDLADAETPEERAQILFEAEIGCYPFWIARVRRD